MTDLFDPMHAAQGAGLAAPQIGVDLQLVIFGFTRNRRYPDRPAVPETVLLNPVITPLSDEIVEGWEGCLSVPGLRGLVPRHARVRYAGQDLQGRPIEREVDGFHAVVVQAAGSSRLAGSLTRVVEQPVVWRTAQHYDRENLLRSYREHEELIAAFERADGAWAASVMTGHIRRAYHVYADAHSGSSLASRSSGA